MCKGISSKPSSLSLCQFPVTNPSNISVIVIILIQAQTHAQICMLKRYRDFCHAYFQIVGHVYALLCHNDNLIYHEPITPQLQDVLHFSIVPSYSSPRKSQNCLHGTHTKVTLIVQSNNCCPLTLSQLLRPELERKLGPVVYKGTKARF